jgi:heme/copper-type cytochrome/quinol oxidase subunit 2
MEVIMDNQTTQYKPVALGDWMITMLICVIPIVNIIMLFVWGFGSNTHPSKANWAKATLIWFAIIIAFYVLVFIAILGGMATS